MGKRIGRTLALLVTAASLAMVADSGAAFAYGHSWSCGTAYSGSQCYDDSGTQYNPWLEIDGQVGASSVHETCAKGITAAGNIRTGSGCFGATFVVACFTSATPDSWAYVYWDGSGGPYGINGHASTTSCE